MRAQHSVVVSRKWNNPEISIDVTHESISIAMSLDDFLLALCREIGSPAGIITRTQLAIKVATAAQKVTESMKQETTRVI